ncbi:GvpL/GvpF family gas vesicle protein [Flavobacterium sp. GSP27]|uniref:GvpL/GvpF family gas vesicle protein n=1 Tax=Flavobacterium bomense TaxID=2497483 RepID=A0A432CMR7_9FLAO|nr:MULTISPECIES: GvpL/GvpF family gas vesicle protein [Flavobacterium]RTY73428.1 GvpL/GvpF family gas vesicle protein [Flavobacterium sp. LS1R10]RTY81534.1 GvpL/GvpF family gas vesicle protein [Flavobacterium sp. ZB4P23]RTY81721.1 GvpL/GvpF family gas vesicle protein [Flavobacterium sp. LS1P28]RTY91454.1 GvpL/GvpF family gas vesicle protein [Flavobacterium sp. RSP46]RTZ04870.1 GvpL/GvpF family gas vesicle protein [Flavobacterium bomense]
MKKMIYSILSVKRNPEKLNALLVGMKGISGSDLCAVSFGEITAVVSDVKRAELIADRSNAIEYAGVIENLAQQFTVLPMRYGSIMESAELINKMLERNYHEFQQNLQEVENKYEFGLKIFCDSEKLKSELKIKSEADTQTTENSATEIKNSVYKDYLDKKLKEHRLEELMLTYVNSVIEMITGYLFRLNTVNKFKKRAITTTAIIDAVFLLDMERKDGLIHVIGDLQNQYPRLNFVLTGPWPPYNFVEIAIK